MPPKQICETTLFPMTLERASQVGLNISCLHSSSTILGRDYFQERMFNSGNANGLATFPQVFLAGGNGWGQSASYWENLCFLNPPNCLPTNSQCFAFLWNKSHSWEVEIALMVKVLLGTCYCLYMCIKLTYMLSPSKHLFSNHKRGSRFRLKFL